VILTSERYELEIEVSSDALIRNEIAVLNRKVAAHHEIIVDQQTLNQIEARRDGEIQNSIQTMNEALKAVKLYADAMREVVTGLQQQVTDSKAEGLLNHVAIAVIAAEASPALQKRLIALLQKPADELFATSTLSADFGDHFARSARSLRESIEKNTLSRPDCVARA
jgi:hypothetical protein